MMNSFAGWARRLRGGVAAVMVAALPVAVPAQTAPDYSRPLTVEQCVALARAQSDLIGQAEGRLDAARGAHLRGYQAVLPNVSASAGWSRDYFDYLGISGVEYSGQFALGVRQTIFDLPSLIGLKAQGEGVRAAANGLDATLAAVELNARQQFYTCLAALKLAEVEDQAVEIAQEQLRRSETLFRLGSVARSDVLQAKVNLAAAEQQAVQRRNAVGTEHAQLALVLGIDPRTKLSVDSTLVVPEADPAGDLDTWIARAMTRRPDLASAEASLAAARLSESAARMQRLPSVSASGRWGRTGRDDAEALLNGPRARYNNAWSVSVGVSLEIFSGLRIEGDIQSAAGSRRAEEASVERQRKEVALEVRNAYNAIREQRESLRAAHTSVSLAEESLRLQQALYESGAGTLLEWDNARLSLRRARVSLIQAEINLALAFAGFRQAVGGV
jgi:outer membrane protein